MQNKKITIALDCMGGDNAPEAIIGGVVLSSHEFKDNVKFLLFGVKADIENCLKNKKMESEYEIINSDIVISSDEKPSLALRKGKNSSMGLAIEAVKLKNADASISAGNTGALMALSKIILRTLPDIDRPALIQLMPTNNGECVALLDMGANIECDSLNLCQFAMMGTAFINAITGKTNPKIGLLNIGSEDIKGNDSIKSASMLLKNSHIKNDFYGFVEGNEILTGKVDVVVSDGFSGNIALKTIEGVCNVFAKLLKELFKSNLITKLAYLLISGKFKILKKRLNPTTYNGAMLIGLNGISMKSHGNADATSFYYAIKNTVNLVKNDINNKIIDLIGKMDFQE